MCCNGSGSGSLAKGYKLDPMKVKFFLWSSFFVMDKDHTMRALKVRSYGAQPPMKASKARSYGTGPSLHDRAGTLLLVYNND